MAGSVADSMAAPSTARSIGSVATRQDETRPAAVPVDDTHASARPDTAGSITGSVVSSIPSSVGVSVAPAPMPHGIATGGSNSTGSDGGGGVLVVMEAKYPRGSNALKIYSDGTGMARWPSGGLAVSVSRDAEGACRLMVNYRGGGTAAMFNSRGHGTSTSILH